MAVYKVPQDVEAEDKLIGPFTFRQFIFLIVAAIALFVTVQLFRINPLLSLITLPIFTVFGVLGVYRRPDQPAEIYLLALLRFYLKPHKRIWDQEGIMENVHITVPKKPVHQFTDGLSQTEVRSRLDNLARVMDSRGWSVKNVEINSPLGTAPVVQSDRLIMPTQQVEPNEIHAADDMLDIYNNPEAQDVQQRMQATASQARQEAVEMMRQAAQSVAPAAGTVITASDDDDSEVSFNPYPSDMRQQVVKPLSTTGKRNKARRQQKTASKKSVEEQEEHAQSIAEQVRESRSHTPGTAANTARRQTAANNREEPSASKMTQQPSDAILRLANNSDLRVSTIASEAARIEALEDNQTIQLH